MRRKQSIQANGFTLLEMMIALSLGLIVIGSAVQLFSKGMELTFLVSQRAEMQQNGRAAVGLLAKDISLAGAGLPTGGVALPTGSARAPIYGCDQVKCYVSGVTPAGIAYPNNQLYGVVPGDGMGIPMSAGGANTDVITIVYSDPTSPLSLGYTITAFGANGTSITVAPPSPMPTPPIPTLLDPAVGIKVGDLILVTNNGLPAVGEVTGIIGNLISFSDLDRLNVNQSTAPGGNMKTICTPCGAVPPPPAVAPTATRISVITYYLDIPTGPDGLRYTADDLPPRLMRQVNGQPAVPVADNIGDLQFSYDIFDETLGADTSNLADAGLSSGKSPNQIRKVNIVSMTTRSAMHGKVGYQGLDLATSVSVRNMSFRDRYQ
jgi:prepilin-type N-terminal cleavage/methylation domain-containing protein